MGRVLVPGQASGAILVSNEPLSFWGGYDYRTGVIIDARHELAGQSAAGRVLALPFARGSSTTTAVMLEAIRAGTGPSAVLTTGADHFLALASIVAAEMYGRAFPVITLAAEDFCALATGQWAEVREDGGVLISSDEQKDEEEGLVGKASA
jgi:predicted aconitase with swiveling domain